MAMIICMRLYKGIYSIVSCQKKVCKCAWYIPVYDAVPKQNTEYQYWKYTEVSLPVWLLK